MIFVLADGGVIEDDDAMDDAIAPSGPKGGATNFDPETIPASRRPPQNVDRSPDAARASAEGDL